MRNQQAQRAPTSFALALCGVSAALAIALMSFASLVPILLFIAPALAGMFVMIVCAECGQKMAICLYAATSLLGGMLVPDKEVVLLFIFLLGYYPLLKAKIERIPQTFFVVALKFLLLNSSMLGMYALLLFLFPVGEISQEFLQTGLWLSVLSLAMGNVAFFFYDKALVNLLRLYQYRWRKRFFGQMRHKR